MRAVGVRELKNRLSEYLRIVRSGEPVLVTDRGVVVAELRPPGTTPGSEKHPGLAELVRRGLLSAVHENDPSAYPTMPRLLPEGEALRMLDELRRDR